MCERAYPEDESPGGISYIFEQCSFYLCSALYLREHKTLHKIRFLEGDTVTLKMIRLLLLGMNIGSVMML